MHRNTGTKTEPVIVEYGFLDSSLDDPEQLKNNWKEYTEAVVDAILEYIKYNNKKMPSLVIENNYQEMLYKKQSAIKSINNQSKEEFINLMIFIKF